VEVYDTAVGLIDVVFCSTVDSLKMVYLFESLNCLNPPYVSRKRDTSKILLELGAIGLYL
jgi:hypothetical protein